MTKNHICLTFCQVMVYSLVMENIEKKNELGLRIKKELFKQGKTQRSLAQRLNMSEEAISRYIAGTREPDSKTIANIATALNVTSDYLLGLEGEEYNYGQVRRMIAREAGEMTKEQRTELINMLLEAFN